ncbi:MAG: transcription termination/antitermination protein NusA [Blastocatellia bacterium]|jgi:N utilization substance protein A|nr:transcription termination/antitermination protein NusA [Blastocatellia bacterium]
MSTSIAQNIEALCQEQGIDRELVVEAIKEAVRAAAKKQFKGGEDIQVDWSPESGLELSASKVVVDDVADPSTEMSIEEARELGGDEVEIGDALLLPMPMEELGRIAAQTAKQILFQKVRDAVRSNVYEQYIDRVGELVNGFVKRFERGNMIVDLGNLEAILPRSQQSRGEQWNQGERIRVVITNVSKESKGPQIEVSRTSPELLERLFEMEVPEIYDGTVVIKSCVREPGERAKIAVVSNERDVDPVGACVGMKGSRVQAIIRELRGEKIDIIEWSEEPSVFAANSLSPAKVNQVRITDIENRQMEVIVNEDQLSLAIGKRGQNVRLATKLVGWNIDIRSEEELKKEVAEQMGAMIASGAPVPLAAIQVVSAQQADTLGEHGVTDIDGLVNTSVDDLVEFLDVSLDEAEKILAAARSVIEIRERSKQPAAEEAESEAADADDETAISAEPEAGTEATGTESEDSTAEGYDEAVKNGIPFSAEANIRAEYSADPVALTEADPMTVDELVLQDAGKDLRPDVIAPAPDLTSLVTDQDAEEFEEELAASAQDEAGTAESPALETSSALESSPDEQAAADESLKDEKQ